MKKINNKEFSFFVPGCLGTCWYGNYHYLEPFTGCEHDCIYCYGKSRSDVTDVLAQTGTPFEKPEIGVDFQTALNEMQNEIAADPKIHTIKLSRYTDIFSKKFVENAYSYEVLRLLTEHPQIKRIIITTKGVPDEKIAQLIENNPQKYSYNAAVKPKAAVIMEESVPPREERLNYAARFNAKGVLTTIHMDPIIIGTDDSEKQMEDFALELKERGLSRVMFSYLLYNDAIAQDIAKKFGEDFFLKLKQNYKHEDRQLLPTQKETVYHAPSAQAKESSAERISKILKKHNFDFVICGLKSSERENVANFKKYCTICDGKFYA